MIVIDTQTLIWWTANSQRLSKRAASALRRHQEVLVPSICCWEYAMLATRGKIRLSRPISEALGEILSQPVIQLQPLTPEIGIRAAGISLGITMDPADQIVAATALELNLPLVTSDGRLREFPGLQTIW